MLRPCGVPAGYAFFFLMMLYLFVEHYTWQHAVLRIFIMQISLKIALSH
jgi:hypothetical protein